MLLLKQKFGVPYMNEQLRKSINVRNIFRRKYDRRIPNRQTWKAYLKQRNKVITLREQSKRKYLMDKCGGKCTNSKDFWKIIKPLISHKNHGSGSDTVLLEDGDVINEQTQVCDVLNKYYTRVNRSGICWKVLMTNLILQVLLRTSNITQA